VGDASSLAANCHGRAWRATLRRGETTTKLSTAEDAESAEERADTTEFLCDLCVLCGSKGFGFVAYARSQVATEK
jgi:hypothetical protein